VLAALAASAEPTPTPTPAPSQPSPVRTPPVPTPKPAARPSPTAQPKPTRTQKPDEWTEARRVFEQLSPDQKNKFLDNLDQWKAMSPEEQELFRDRELFRREKIAEEIQDAIVKSGLRLDDDQREVYALRYTQERRKIEEALRKEIDIKRRAMVGDMLVRLKTEFTQAPPAENSSP
jgi:cation diffusion facilitator CzcD-associated flavoprotein CzcO